MSCLKESLVGSMNGNPRRRKHPIDPGRRVCTLFSENPASQYSRTKGIMHKNPTRRTGESRSLVWGEQWLPFPLITQRERMSSDSNWQMERSTCSKLRIRWVWCKKWDIYVTNCCLLLLQEEMNSWLGRINAVITESQQSPGASRSSQTLPARGVSPEAEARKKERAKKTKTMLPGWSCDADELSWTTSSSSH